MPQTQLILSLLGASLTLPFNLIPQACIEHRSALQEVGSPEGSEGAVLTSSIRYQSVWLLNSEMCLGSRGRCLPTVCSV